MKRTTKLLMAALVPLALLSCTEQAQDWTRYVNPFIGTGGHGHTFPGATYPFGMVQLSPDTRFDGWDACSGYHHSDSTINGFSHNHLSGTGCADYGDILFMPVTGSPAMPMHDRKAQQLEWASAFTHQNEEAQPGYYRVMLERYGVNAELTTGQRVGMHRYTYPEGAEAQVIVDLDWSIQPQETLVLQLEVVNDREIRGYKKTNFWAFEQGIYFHAFFSEPFTYEFVSGDERRTDVTRVEGRGKLLLTFPSVKGRTVLAKVGLSAVDTEGARNNVVSEVADWDFDALRRSTSSAWNDYLATVEVDANAPDDQKQIYYTALYHSAISPTIFSDADGRYLGMDHQIHTTTADHPIYTVFSLWDTFRALHPFFTITQPSRNADFVRSLVTKAEEGGLYPMWELAGNYTGCMIGYHAVSVVADAYIKGARGFDEEEAFRHALKVSSFDTTGIRAPRAVLAHLMPKAKYYNDKVGFVPADRENESVAKALEYAYNDWCIAQWAKARGDESNARVYTERSMRYKQYYDPQTMFMRGLDENGEWHLPFDPRVSEHRNDPYCEGTAWQWTWFVPHDVAGLVTLMGGKENFVARLDSLFLADSRIEGANISSDISGLIGQYAHGNEPSHHIAHLYNYVGQGHKTQALLDSIYYSQYTPQIDGLAGNEDCGQMSAWLLMNAMGLYQVAPGNPVYSIGLPYFKEMKVRLESGKQLRIEAAQLSRTNKYVQRVTFNGNVLETPFITHGELMQGGVLSFEMGSKPAL